MFLAATPPRCRIRLKVRDSKQRKASALTSRRFALSLSSFLSFVRSFVIYVILMSLSLLRSFFLCFCLSLFLHFCFSSCWLCVSFCLAFFLSLFLVSLIMSFLPSLILSIFFSGFSLHSFCSFSLDPPPPQKQQCPLDHSSILVLVKNQSEKKPAVSTKCNAVVFSCEEV